MATQINVIDVKGKESGKVDLPESIFAVETNVPLIHQVVVAQLAAARQGTHKVKNRGEVSGSGRKPFKQKGTGNARQGSVRMPQHTGGGIVHGPTPRSYAQRTPKKMVAAALLGALSDRARTGNVHIIESLVAETPKTKQALAVLNTVSDVAAQNVLLVFERGQDEQIQAIRNVPSVHYITWDQLNAYDVVRSDDLVFTKEAFDAFVAAKQGAETAAPVAAAPAAAKKKADAPKAEKAAPAADEVEFENAAAPLEDGAAPEGYTIKGNKDSMKFHRPDGRWFEQTVAEVWFRTAEDAEAAGFVEAGKPAKATEEDKDEN
ncbi:50S ribosomal protein L4, sunset domain variant [Agrococcus casei]|uniref:50S ribosomal protein L4, sunset domain variant n=1 Tax=Agrococcus casei TaxID=343512 RepID=UPI003F90742B